MFCLQWYVDHFVTVVYSAFPNSDIKQISKKKATAVYIYIIYIYICGIQQGMKQRRVPTFLYYSVLFVSPIISENKTCSIFYFLQAVTSSVDPPPPGLYMTLYDSVLRIRSVCLSVSKDGQASIHLRSSLGTGAVSRGFFLEGRGGIL